MSDSPPLLASLRNVGIGYRRRRGFLRGSGDVFWALRDVTLDLHRGEALGLVGRNGAGKSTLLKLLAGLIRPDEGTIEAAGGHATLLSLQVGFAPQLTGRENAVLSGLLLGLRRRDIESAMERIIRFADIDDFIDQPVATYSTGMRARLGFAVALECDSDTLLIDETLGVGDAEFQQKCQVVIKERVRPAGTVVLASHSSAAIRQLCTRAVWLERGQIRAQGDVVTILAAYERFLRNLAGGGTAAASAGGGDHPAAGGGPGDARAWKSG